MQQSNAARAETGEAQHTKKQPAARVRNGNVEIAPCARSRPVRRRPISARLSSPMFIQFVAV
jgi:hypothetical protein